ncbi:hypothetical protein ACFPL7_08710 [Dongia soli]|uniref:Uncharacterized protein n=1 Tax=Dongia soli TaxID=600628 RepID=A0ABU5EAW2_9PROT|nr:hypothetical protein [Dongia soli]MDY0883027.1 hypothetical protein [Dongia soli]
MRLRGKERESPRRPAIGDMHGEIRAGPGLKPLWQWGLMVIGSFALTLGLQALDLPAALLLGPMIAAIGMGLLVLLLGPMIARFVARIVARRQAS